MRRGSFTLALLQAIGNLTCGVAELVDAMTSGRSESYRKLRGIQPAAPNVKRLIRNTLDSIENKMIAKQRIYQRISQLKKDGLISERKIKNKTILDLSDRGLEKLSSLESNLKIVPSYRAEKSDQLVIVAFDVPEKERWKRHWLRSAIKNLGLDFLQQSLWIGKVKLPREFIDDLDELRLSNYVEIFAVTKRGTIKQIV